MIGVMRCPNLANDLCYSTLPSSVVYRGERGGDGTKRFCDTSEYTHCPRYRVKHARVKIRAGDT